MLKHDSESQGQRLPWRLGCRQILDFPPDRLDNQTVVRIVIEHLTKTFVGPKGERVCALSDVNLTVEPGELLVLVGPSGCGKTTTLRLIAGLENPSSGTISIEGQSLEGVPPKDRNLAMVFQNPALYPHMNVWENLAFGLKARKLPSVEIERRVHEAAEMLELTDCLARRPMELSGGQCQRVALGRALVRRPKVLLFDEPLSNLDVRMRAQMRVEIARLHTKIAATTIYVTHDQLEALTLGHRVGVMQDGEIQQVSRPMELYRAPETLFAAEFIGYPPMNLIAGTIEAQEGVVFFHPKRLGLPDAPQNLRLRASGPQQAELAKYIGREVLLGIRPEHVCVSPGLERGPEEEKFRTVVEFVEQTGPDTYLHFASGKRRIIALVRADSPARVGDEVLVGFDLAHARFFDPSSGNAIRCES